jgi:hypothetical protein
MVWISGISIPRTRCLSRTGETDQIAVGIGELRDREVFTRILHWAHHACSPRRTAFSSAIPTLGTPT